MTEADGLKNAAFAILNELQLVVGNGAAAMTEVNEAAALLRIVVDKLKGSRTFALQELEQLIAVAAMSERLFQDSNSIDIMGAVIDFKQAAQDVEDYSNRVHFTIQKLEQVLEVLTKHRRDQELDASGIRLQKGVKHIQNYRNYL